MKRLDDGKVSLVEFMRSIKFRQRTRRRKVSTHFAELHPRARQPQAHSGDDYSLVRSAN